MLNDTNPIFEFRGPFGVPIQIGGSILLLIGFYLYSGGGDMVWSLIFVAMLFFSILLHEIGHAWGSLIQGVPVRRIMLYGGGGFCERQRSASAFQQELIVAMGPIVNLVLWASCSLWSEWLWSSLIADAARSPNPELLFTGPKAQLAEYVGLFAYVNGFLALFNLIPVQPLDGGKLLQLILLRLTSSDTARLVTGSIGLVIAIIWIPAMLLAFGLGLWILFFIPSIPLHWAMITGRAA